MASRDDGTTFAVNLIAGDVRGTQDGRATRRARKLDAAWFARRPHRTIRFRDPLPGELREMIGSEPEPVVSGYPLRVVIEQIRPGVRRRSIVYAALKHEPEPVLRAFVDLYERALQQGYYGELTKDDILAGSGSPDVRRH